MAEPFVVKERRGAFKYQLIVEIEPFEIAAADPDTPSERPALRGGVRLLYVSPGPRMVPANTTVEQRQANPLTWDEWDRLVAWVSAQRAAGERDYRGDGTGDH